MRRLAIALIVGILCVGGTAYATPTPTATPTFTSTTPTPTSTPTQTPTATPTPIGATFDQGRYVGTYFHAPITAPTPGQCLYSPNGMDSVSGIPRATAWTSCGSGATITTSGPLTGNGSPGSPATL